LADAAGQAILDQIEGQGTDDLDGPDTILDLDDPAAPQAVVKGGGGHAQTEAIQGCLPPLVH
jgi:hypothetical protein